MIGAISFSDSDTGARRLEQFRQDVLDPSATSSLTGRPARMNCELLHVVEQRAERIPEAFDVGDQDRLLVAAELRPGELLDQFLQRADAAGQRHEGVGALEHDALALVHVAGDDHLLRAHAACARG